MLLEEDDAVAEILRLKNILKQEISALLISVRKREGISDNDPAANVRFSIAAQWALAMRATVLSLIYENDEESPGQAARELFDAVLADCGDAVMAARTEGRFNLH